MNDKQISGHTADMMRAYIYNYAASRIDRSVLIVEPGVGGGKGFVVRNVQNGTGRLHTGRAENALAFAGYLAVIAPGLVSFKEEH